jgi:hypothetical protein
MANVNLALQRLDQYGIKHQRPADYYAETLKTDDQMLKIKVRSPCSYSTPPRLREVFVG